MSPIRVINDAPFSMSRYRSTACAAVDTSLSSVSTDCTGPAGAAELELELELLPPPPLPLLCPWPPPAGRRIVNTDSTLTTMELRCDATTSSLHSRSIVSHARQPNAVSEGTASDTFSSAFTAGTKESLRPPMWTMMRCRSRTQPPPQQEGERDCCVSTAQCASGIHFCVVKPLARSVHVDGSQCAPRDSE